MWMTTEPPVFKTRKISAAARRGFSRCSKTLKAKTQSKIPLRNGRQCASPTTSVLRKILCSNSMQFVYRLAVAPAPMLGQTFCLREESFRTQHRVDCSYVRREQSARAPAKRGEFDRASQKSPHNFRMLADRAPNEERGGIQGRPESKLVAGSSLEVRRLSFGPISEFRR